MKRIAWSIIILLTAAQTLSAAQVAARQGTSPEQHFESPMILDLPLPPVVKLGEDSAMRLADVRNYICDNHVSLVDLLVTKRYKGRKKSRSMELVLSGSVLVTASYDRRVDIGVKLRSGENELSKQTLHNRSAEEGRETPFRILLPADESSLAAAHASEQPPIAEIVLTVRDDS